MKINLDWTQCWESLQNTFQMLFAAGGPDGLEWGIGIATTLVLFLGVVFKEIMRTNR